MKKFICFFLLLFAMKNNFQAQTVLPLYTGDIPNSKPGPDEEKTETSADGIKRISKISRPTLTIFLPEEQQATGTAVIICPGGGYGINANSHEGTDVAAVFAKSGVTAFVLKYRLPSDVTMVNKELGPLQDAQQAIKLVRERAREWRINPARIGIMGFSAGGHLASTAGTHFSKVAIPNKEQTSVRPDFMILIYPVINMNDSTVTHKGSATQLLGKKPTAEMLAAYSNELNVNAQTPPTFLVHATDDKGVSATNSLLFYEALLKNNVPTELHIYQEGGHGFGMKMKKSNDLWMERCINWMAANGWTKK